MISLFTSPPRESNEELVVDVESGYSLRSRMHIVGKFNGMLLLGRKGRNPDFTSFL